jgi:CO/xanthine dehydrogenase FAD-binding subunit
MIPFDFIYCRPESLQETAEAYRGLRAEGKAAVYYAGGSEIITLCRAGAIRPDAVVDIKNIPQCRCWPPTPRAAYRAAPLHPKPDQTVQALPLLSLACGGSPTTRTMPDHPGRKPVRLGHLPETSLPLLLCDAGSPSGARGGARPSFFEPVFGRMRLNPGELVVQSIFPAALYARHATSSDGE